MMRKNGFFTVLFITLSSLAFAQTSDSATLTITGSVEKIVTIAVTPTGNSDLNLTADVADRSVARVNEYANVRAGYYVDVTSANGWKLTGTAHGDSLAYSASYDGLAVNTTAATARITDANDRTGTAGDTSGIDKEFTVSYSAATANLYNDEYADTLTFTITAK